ncbi:hypothetical protein BJX96DRAFT_179055 [Aspergillus floccosus]
MYNLTHGDAEWKSGVSGLLNSTLKTFSPRTYGGGDVMIEVARELSPSVPAPKTIFSSRLRSLAMAAAKQRSGGANKSLCGRHWYQADRDGTTKLQEQVLASNFV